MEEIKDIGRPKKVCEKCKRDIPYLLSVDGGLKFKCPSCLQIVEYNKCIFFEKDLTENIKNK